MCRAALCRAVQRKYSGCAVPCAVRYSDCRALQPCRVGECTGRGQEVGQRPLRSRAAHVWYVVCVRDPRRATAGPDTVAVEHLSLVLRFRDTLSAVLLVVGRPRRRRRVLAGLTARLATAREQRRRETESQDGSAKSVFVQALLVKLLCLQAFESFLVRSFDIFRAFCLPVRNPAHYSMANVTGKATAADQPVECVVCW